MPTKILIADDNRTMREALRLIVSEHTDWVICGEAADGLEAVSKATELIPDIVILDLTMPKLNGLQAASAIHTAAPKIPMMLFTQHNVDAALAAEARKAGFSGAVTKGSLNSLIVGIEHLLRGENYFPSSFTVTTVNESQPAESVPQITIDDKPEENS